MHQQTRLGRAWGAAPDPSGGRCARRGWAVLVLALAMLTGCAGRPGPEVLAPVAVSVPEAQTITVYVATTRARAAEDSNVFTSQPGRGLNYAAFKISIPPTHKPGAIEWPKGAGDPARDFVVVEQQRLDRASFQRLTLAETRERGLRRYGVFVHGYNNNFQEALFRVAQMAQDSGHHGTTVLFDWPSAAKVAGYVTDKDNATYSRDGLVDTLTLLARQPGTNEVTLFGHSMGGWLTVESVRQLRLMGRNDVIAKLNVILAAPDIDVPVFMSQLEVIGPLKPPLTVLVSRDDKALGFSRRIAGERQRLGAIDVNNPLVQEAAARGHVQVVDISSVAATSGMNHDRYVEFVALYPSIRGQAQASTARSSGAFVFNDLASKVPNPFTPAQAAATH
ncbi:Alpha/beta hydrolase family protein [Methyloligella halotolerans]|uniref:Alpha/beta hydrolase family protein n=1 Tax=Methyloligella halotolerans TaxID=1177755 RepID=A0A1E2RWI7_9HYPH|nr:alpha/beta fold hydrolase [Methyloligella halotolerans]ODA66500.1 Alpha/beta hydrolase family protein [Methyloligella halotolerans]